MNAKAWFLVLVSALLQAVLFPSLNWFLLGWVAFVPWLLVLYRQHGGGWRSLLVDVVAGWVCGTLWYLGTCYWIYHAMRTHGGLGVPAATLVVILFSLYLGIYHALFAGLVSWLRLRRLPLRWLMVLTPFLWTAVELARSRVTSFPWDLLGYTQADNLPLSRIATITGVFGLSWVVMLVNAVLAGGVLMRRRGLRLILLGAAAAVVLQSTVALHEPASAVDHEAVLLQQDLPLESPEGWSPADFDSTISALVRASEPGGLTDGGGSKLIVWPESPAPFFANDPRFTRWMDALAEDAHAWIIAGALGTPPGARAEPPVLFNSASLFSPQGQSVSRYDKVHLVPFGEYVPLVEYLRFASDLTREVGTFTRGADRPLLEAGEIRAGTFICYESVFPDEVRLFAKEGATVLVNISNDGWFGDSGAPGQHLANGPPARNREPSLAVAYHQQRNHGSH